MITHPYSKLTNMLKDDGSNACDKFHIPWHSGLDKGDCTYSNVTIDGTKFIFNGDGGITCGAPVIGTEWSEKVVFTTGADVTTRQGVIGCYNSSGARYWAYVDSGNLTLLGVDDDGLLALMQTSVIINTTYDIFITRRTDGLLYLYKDGVYQNSKTFGICTPTANYAIGNYAATYYLTGSVQCFFRFNESYTADEIEAMYNMTNF